MLRTALLVVALLIPGLTHASEAPAKAVAPAAPKLCSDYEKQFPPCDLPNADKKKAKHLYEQAIKLAQKKQYSEALEKLKARAGDLAPGHGLRESRKGIQGDSGFRRSARGERSAAEGRCDRSLSGLP